MLPLTLVLSTGTAKRYASIGVDCLEKLVCYDKAPSNVRYMASVYILSHYSEDVTFTGNTVRVKLKRRADEVNWGCVAKSLTGSEYVDVYVGEGSVTFYLKPARQPRLVMPDVAKMEENIRSAISVLDSVRQDLEDKMFEATLDEKVMFTQIIVLNPWVVLKTLKSIRLKIEEKRFGSAYRRVYESIVLKKLPVLAKLYVKAKRYPSLRKYAKMIRGIIEEAYKIALKLEEEYSSIELGEEIILGRGSGERGTREWLEELG